MSTVFRTFTVVALVATCARALTAQPAPHPSPPTPVAPAPNVPTIPPPPAFRNFGDFGRAMGAWGDSFGQVMGALGDSLGRLGSQLAEAEQEETAHPSHINRARIDSLQHAMQTVEHRMGGGRFHHDWRAFARQAHEAARDARRGERGAAQGARDSRAQVLDRVRRDPEAIQLPSTDSFSDGELTIPPKTQHAGTAATINGNLEVFGTVTGDAIAVDGDVEIHPGAHVLGTAFAAGGEVRVDSAGLVDGEIRSLGAGFGTLPTTPLARAAGSVSRWHSARMALVAVALALMLGIGVLTFAEDQLDHVTGTLADRFGRSAWYGVVGTVAMGPVLLAMIIALAITIIGALAIPFAVAAYAAMVVGAGTLGFIAVAESTGTAILRSHTQATLTPRGAQLRAIVAGISIYGGLWLLSAIVGTDFVVGMMIRGLAVVVTSVAITVGFGAVLLWRFDVRRANRRAASTSATPVDESLWQTPTPVAGVAAARRTTPATAQPSEKT